MDKRRTWLQSKKTLTHKKDTLCLRDKQTRKSMSWQYFLIKLRPNYLDNLKHRQLRGSDGLSYLVFVETFQNESWTCSHDPKANEAGSFASCFVY